MPLRSDLPVPLNGLGANQAFFDSQLHLSDAPVSLPVANPTQAFWLHPSKDVNPLAREGSEGHIIPDADICIIGSGITGVSAAYHLSRSCPDKRVVIFEARDFCTGATGRNGGHLTPNVLDGLVSYASAMGIDEAKKQFALERYTVDCLAKIIEQNEIQETVDFVSGGHITLLFTEEEFEGVRADYRLAQEVGLDVSDVSFLSKEEVLSIFGAAYPAVRSPGHNLWPLKLVTQLFYLAKERFAKSSGSLSLFTSTPVTAISPADDGNSGYRWTLSTPRSSISCTSILHATNAYASYLLPFLAGPKGIVPVRGQIIATRAEVQLSYEERASWSANEHYEYWFPPPPKGESDVQRPLIILGGGREAANNWELGVTDDSVLDQRTRKLLRQFLPAVFPDKFKEETEPEQEWTGIMGFTSNRDPFVGPVFTPDGSELKGQYIGAGFSGNGMPRTFGCAEAVVSLLAHDLAGLSRESWIAPDWLPKRYLTWYRR